MPDPADDPIIRLFDYYFTTADVIYIDFKKLWEELLRKEKLSSSKTIRLQRLFQIWLGMLYVTIEGFESAKIRAFFASFKTDSADLRGRWYTVQHQIGQLGPELKGYRNVTFHFQETMTRLEAKRFEFLRHPGRRNPISWAQELHEEMLLFFSAYRVDASCRFMIEKYKKKEVNP